MAEDAKRVRDEAGLWQDYYTGLGKLALGGANNYTGGTTFNAFSTAVGMTGVLAISSNSAFGPGPITLASGLLQADAPVITYDKVDTSLVAPRARTYGKKTESPATKATAAAAPPSAAPTPSPVPAGV